MHWAPLGTQSLYTACGRQFFASSSSHSHHDHHPIPPETTITRAMSSSVYCSRGGSLCAPTSLAPRLTGVLSAAAGSETDGFLPVSPLCRHASSGDLRVPGLVHQLELQRSELVC